jgi:hypothetical protein
VEEELSGWEATQSKALYVNIGGGIGHQCAQFKARYHISQLSKAS